MFRVDADPVVAAAMLAGLAGPMVYMMAGDARSVAEIRDRIVESFLRSVCV